MISLVIKSAIKGMFVLEVWKGIKIDEGKGKDSVKLGCLIEMKESVNKRKVLN